MGNRVLIQFKDNRNVLSDVCYLHDGGDFAEDLIRECAKQMKGCKADAHRAMARFVSVCVMRKVGVKVRDTSKLLALDDSEGDAGCYVVDCNTWEVTAFGGYGDSFTAR